VKCISHIPPEATLTWPPIWCFVAGLQLLQDFVSPSDEESLPLATTSPRGLAKRVIACLDVRANDRGDLVVTKGDQYDVRESSNEDGSSGEVSCGHTYAALIE
jgi:hypothetical protein